MSAPQDKRHEALIAANLEGVTTQQEDAQLWRRMEMRRDVRVEFLAARHIHYLLKTLLDHPAQEKAFARRVTNALHPDTLSEAEFAAAVQSRLNISKPDRKSFIFDDSIWRIAASVLIVIGCAALFAYSYFRPPVRPDNRWLSMDAHVMWAYESPISQLRHDMKALYPPAGSKSCFYACSSNYFSSKAEQIERSIARSKNTWFQYNDRVYFIQQGDPL